jgi:hypothetical protein
MHINQVVVAHSMTHTAAPNLLSTTQTLAGRIPVGQAPETSIVDLASLRLPVAVLGQRAMELTGLAICLVMAVDIP